MFRNLNKRYVTRGISQSIPPEVARTLWNMIDKWNEKEKELDYLQIFELSFNNGKQSILHRQESPPLEEQHMIEWKSTIPIVTKIWCIDDGEAQIMMFPKEY